MDINQGSLVVDREDKGIEVFIRDEKGERMVEGDVPVSITVAGSYSRTYKAAQDAARDRNLKRRRAVLDGDQLEDQSLEITAACILAWQGWTNGGAALPLNKPNAVMLLRKLPWVREQVEAAMHDHAAFFSTASSS